MKNLVEEQKGKKREDEKLVFHSIKRVEKSCKKKSPKKYKVKNPEKKNLEKINLEKKNHEKVVKYSCME